MPANSRVFLKPFIGGLNTEASDTDDMVLNTSEELNCTILPEQMRGRRYGFNIEPEGKWIDANETIQAHCVYHWNNVYDDNNFVVVQINKKLYIFNDSYPISQSAPLKTFDLSEFATMDNVSPIDMTSVSDTLFIAGRWLYPLVIKYDVNTGDFTTPEKNNPKFRDFNGIDDDLKIDECPVTLSKKHMYNLINQGWDKEIYDPVNHTYTPLITTPANPSVNGKFFDDIGKFPANNMQWFLGKEKSGEYNTADLLNVYFGNTPAPKGHYILDYIHRSRSYTCGFTLDSEPFSTLKYSQNNWENMPNGLLDDNKWITSNKAWHMYHGRNGTDGYCIKGDQIRSYFFKYLLPANVSENAVKSVIVRIFTKVISWSTSAAGGLFYPDFVRSTQPKFLYSNPFVLSLIGIDADGTEHVLGTQDCRMEPNHTAETEESFTVSTDNTSTYAQYAVKISWPEASTEQYYWYPQYTRFNTAVSATATEVVGNFIDGLPSSDTLKGAITDVESFGGRIFYLCGNTVLFSQTLSTDNKNYDKCYQESDPTSEEINDVLATDGGMIQMLTLGRGKAMKRFYRGVLVFGDKEVTGILSNSINLFSAESYDVVKITTAGLAGRYSVVETDNNIFYWSQHGIYMIGIDENNNISSNCISLNSIQNWYMNLDQVSKENVTGYYDYANNRIYWFYPTTLDTEKLDGCLVYDLTFNSFMPQSIDCGNVVRDIYGEYAGRIDRYLNKVIRYNSEVTDITIEDNRVYDKAGNLIGYIQPNYITDCCESTSVNYITPTYRLRAGGDIVKAGGDYVSVGTSNDIYYDRKSAGVILISNGTQFSFGDFNDREFHDWDVSPFESYLVSRPITLGDTYFNKQTPVMQTLFKRTEEHKLRDDTDIEDIANTRYQLTGGYIKYEQGYPKYNCYYNVPNQGKFKSAKVSVDLTEFEGRTFTIIATVYGSNSNLTSGIDSITFNSESLYSVEGGRKYNLEVVCPEDKADEIRQHFTIRIALNCEGTIDTTEADIKCLLTLDRTEATDPTIVGWRDEVVEGNIGLSNRENPSSGVYRYTSYGIDLPTSYIKYATCTFKNYPDAVFDMTLLGYNWRYWAGHITNMSQTPNAEVYPTPDLLYNKAKFIATVPDVSPLYFLPPEELGDTLNYSITCRVPVYKTKEYMVEGDVVTVSKWNNNYQSEDIPLNYELASIDVNVVPSWTGEEAPDWYCKCYMWAAGYKQLSKANPTATFEVKDYPYMYTHLTLGDWLVEEVDKPQNVDIFYTLHYKPLEPKEVIVPAKYTTPSGVIIRMRWGWSVDPLSNRWDMMQNGYRPQKDFMHDDYVESRLHIHGRGKAFQIEIRNDSNKDFRLTGLNIITRSPQ